MNVLIQEAASCSNPLRVSSINSDGLYDALPDDQAFDWAQDLLATMAGNAADAVPWLRWAADNPRLAESFGRALEAVPTPRARLRVTRYSTPEAEYHAVWSDLGDSVRMELGATTGGLPVIDSESNPPRGQRPR